LRLQRMSPSLIGYLGQALFPLFDRVIVAHPGHASNSQFADFSAVRGNCEISNVM
jgi:hypothetical protein